MQFIQTLVFVIFVVNSLVGTQCCAVSPASVLHIPRCHFIFLLLLTLANYFVSMSVSQFTCEISGKGKTALFLFSYILHLVPSQQSKDCLRLDETMLVKQLLPEICHFIHTYREGHHHAVELRASASAVLFSLSCNNFNAVFSRISTRFFVVVVVSVLSPERLSDL